MNICEVIVKTLESIGVDHAYGGSGQSDGDFLFALKDSTIKTIIIRHEQAASFMACGYAMFSDKLGVCFATGGPGAFNLFSGLAVAYSDSLPVLAISGYAAKETVGKGDLGDTTGILRTPDSITMFSATTKKSFIIKNAEQTCDILEEALNLAFEGRPGPVHIHLPYDIASDEVKNYRPVKVNVKPVLPEPKKISLFADVLAKAINEQQQLALLLGYGCIRSHAQKELLNFVEKFQIPFITTMDAKGILPENHPLSLGTTGVSGDPGAKTYFQNAKLIFAMGNSFAKWSTYKFRNGLFDDKILMHINIDKNEINKVYQADYSMVADIKPAIAGISEKLSQKVNHVAKKQITRDKYHDEKIEHNGKKIHPGQLVQEISKHLPENSIILGDAGNHMLWLHAYLSLDKGQVYQNPGVFGPMASHVNGAIGVKCANPDKVVVAGVGDGDYQMAGFELMTAVQNKIPVIWIIFDNNEYNVIKFFQMRIHDGREVFNHFLNPDFAAYARACGAKGYRVEKIEDFGNVFQEAIAANEPTVIDVVVENEVYPPFHVKN